MSFVEKKKKKLGDRKDGHLVRDIPVINKLLINLYPKRCDSEVSSKVDFDITNLMSYIKARKEKDPQCEIKFFHCFIAALTRVINERPLLLRFVQNQKLYEKDEIRISFVAKRAFNDKAEETVVHYIPKKDENVDSVSNFILNEVKGVRNTSVEEIVKNDKESAESFSKIPSFLLRIACRMLRWLDKHGWVPKVASNDDPSFSTVLLANLGSIGAKSVYHHLNNYGTCSMMITIGIITDKKIKHEDGKEETRTFVDVTGTFDERIADGFYFLKSMKLMQEYFNHPEALEKSFEEEVKFD